MGITLVKLLPYVTSAIAVAGLVVQLIFPEGSKRWKRAVAVVAVVAAMVAFGCWEAWNQARHVEAASNEILSALGNERKAFEQLLRALRPAYVPVAREALDSLMNTAKVGHSELRVHDDYGKDYHIWVYYKQ